MPIGLLTDYLFFLLASLPTQPCLLTTCLVVCLLPCFLACWPAWRTRRSSSNIAVQYMVSLYSTWPSHRHSHRQPQYRRVWLCTVILSVVSHLVLRPSFSICFNLRDPALSLSLSPREALVCWRKRVQCAHMYALALTGARDIQARGMRNHEEEGRA